jgi:hypothetical protein
MIVLALRNREDFLKHPFVDKGTIRTRVSVEIVAGPILISTGIAWALDDRGHMTWFVLMPMLLVLLGVLMLIARRANIPERRVRQTKIPARNVSSGWAKVVCRD